MYLDIYLFIHSRTKVYYCCAFLESVSWILVLDCSMLCSCVCSLFYLFVCLFIFLLACVFVQLAECLPALYVCFRLSVCFGNASCIHTYMHTRIHTCIHHVIQPVPGLTAHNGTPSPNLHSLSIHYCRTMSLKGMLWMATRAPLPSHLYLKDIWLSDLSFFY